MSFTESELRSASRYNSERDGSLWEHAQLPWPLNSTYPDEQCFAQLVALFQIDNGLLVDGKLGPNTLSTLRLKMRTWGSKPHKPADDGTANAPPKRLGASNELIVAGARMSVPTEFQSEGLTVTNFVSDNEHHFEHRRRAAPVEHLVIHESVTRSAAATVYVLEKKGFGVHLIISPDGHVSCHNDLVDEQPIHANQLNSTSIGVEVVNPYATRWMKEPWLATIAAKWWTWVPEGSRRQYVLPTDAQLRSLKFLSLWLTDTIDSLPLRFPSQHLNWRQRKIKGWKKGAKPAPGIVAHQDFASHADGRWPLETLFDL